MTDDERIENLLDRWETAAEKGNELAAEELCQDCPHLTVRLLEEIRALRATEWLRQSSQINRSRPTLAEGTSREAKRPRTWTCLADRYFLVEWIGEGGSGEVWRALDLNLGRDVAIKLPRAGRWEVEVGNDRMLAEARRLGQLQHPSIANIYSVDSSGDFNFIVSKLMLSNLADCVSRVRPTVAESVRAVAAIAGAVMYAHSEGLVHRDIKPANVLLDRNGQVYLSDFGIAIEGQVTTGGGHTGTPAYMAPEQVAGGPVGPPADVWGLGVLLYELLARRRPFETVSEADMSECILRHQPDAPSTWYPSIPPELDSLCLACLSKDPGLRPGGAFFVEAQLYRMLPPEYGRVVPSDKGPLSRLVQGVQDWKDPDDGLFYLLLGRARRAANSLDAALTNFNRAIDLSPNNPASYFERAELLRRKSDAIIVPLNINPDHALCSSWDELSRKIRNPPLKIVGRRPPRLDLAIKDYTEAIRLAPGVAMYYKGRGDARAQAGEVDLANADYAEAIRLDPLLQSILLQSDEAERRMDR